MTGSFIGAVFPEILTSGFTFLNVDAHCQEMIKSGGVIPAVVADQWRSEGAARPDATRPLVG